MLRYSLFLAIVLQCIASTPPAARLQSLYLANAARYPQYPQLGEKTVDTVMKLLSKGTVDENYHMNIVAYAACDYIPNCTDDGRFSEQTIRDISDGVHDDLLATIKLLIHSMQHAIHSDEL